MEVSKKIVLAGEDYNKIIKVCSPATSKDWQNRPILSQIELLVIDGKCTATALNGYIMAQCLVKCTGDNGQYVIPVVKINARSKKITITIQGDTVSISDGDMTYAKKRDNSPYINWAEIVGADKEIQYSIYLSPQLLRQISSQLSGEYDSSLRLDFRRPTDAVHIVGHSVRGMILPMIVRGDPEVWFEFS